MFNVALVEVGIKLLRGLGLLKDPEAEERARREASANLAAFLTSTSSPLYAVPRVFIIVGAVWDIFFNDSQRWARAVQNMAAQGWAGYLELLPVFWLLVGPEKALDLIKAVWESRKAAQNVGTAAPAPRPGRVDEPGRRDP